MSSDAHLVHNAYATWCYLIALNCECSFMWMQPKPIKKASPSQAILCINRTKKSIHVRIYKLTRIWSIKNIPVLATEERSTTINYTSPENAVFSYMFCIKLEPVAIECSVWYISLHLLVPDQSFWTYFAVTLLKFSTNISTWEPRNLFYSVFYARMTFISVNWKQ